MEALFYIIIILVIITLIENYSKAPSEPRRDYRKKPGDDHKIYRDKSFVEHQDDYQPKDVNDDLKYTDYYDRVPSEYYEEYNDYLISPEWQELRHLVLKRDGYKCQGEYHKSSWDHGILHVHHLHYKGIDKGMNFKPEQLVVLCSECHSKIHSHMS